MLLMLMLVLMMLCRGDGGVVVGMVMMFSDRDDIDVGAVGASVGHTSDQPGLSGLCTC